MFFKISKTPFETLYPLNTIEQVNDLYLATDLGWQTLDNVVYKGYCLDQTLQSKVESRDFTEETGNYCIIDLNNTSVHYDNSRSFPIFYSNETVSNLRFTDCNECYFDGAVNFTKNNWESYHRPELSAHSILEQPTISKESIVDLMCENFVNYVNSCTTELPLYCADSNGVDSTAVRSAFDYCGKKYTLVKENTNNSRLGWGYNQLYTNSDAHLQITGFCGDEMFLRNPRYCQWLLDPHGIDLVNEFDKIEHSYMKGFFNHGYKQKLIDRDKQFHSSKEAIEHTANTVNNDYQMWHIDQILTFTPFRNVETSNKLLFADPDAILDQVLNAGLSKAIINRLNKKLLHTISTDKNGYKV